MYYYVFKDVASELYIVDCLSNIGYSKSEYSCGIGRMKAIALDSYDGKYIFLNEVMMDPDPTIGWIEPYRKKINNIEEFLQKAEEIVHGPLF